MKVKIKKLREDARIPEYAHEGDAGMDLFSCEDCIILPKHRQVISTGIAMEIPKGYVGLIWDKSGIAKNGITTISGVGDSGYRGEYKVVLLNVSSKPYVVKKGQKIAQMLIQKVESPKLVEVKEISDTERGVGGFGSTGLK